MTIEKFLEKENPELYDFKREMQPYYEKYGIKLKNYPYEDEAKDNIDQYFIYKEADEDIKGRKFDCDSSNDTCKLTTDIYKCLWDYVKSPENKIWKWKDIDRNSFYSFGGETMNSFKTTYNIWKKSSLSDDAKLRNKFNEFAKLTHTVGNFVLVPYGFNGWRYPQTSDYWDASLYILKKAGYEKDEKRVFEPKNFNRYINYFFLWDYVEVVDDEYKVKKLFASQGFDRSNKSEPLENELYNFVKTVNENIRSRGEFIVNMLKIANADDDKYKELQKMYFLKDEVFSRSKIDEIKKEIETIMNNLGIK